MRYWTFFYRLFLSYAERKRKGKGEIWWVISSCSFVTISKPLILWFVQEFVEFRLEFWIFIQFSMPVNVTKNIQQLWKLGRTEYIFYHLNKIFLHTFCRHAFMIIPSVLPCSLPLDNRINERAPRLEILSHWMKTAMFDVSFIFQIQQTVNLMNQRKNWVCRKTVVANKR